MKFKHQDIEILRTLKPLIKNKNPPKRKTTPNILKGTFGD